MLFWSSNEESHPSKRGVIGELPSSKNMLSCRPKFYWHCQLNFGFVPHYHKSLKTQHPPRRWFRWAVQAHLFGFSSASYRLTPTTLAFARYSLTFLFARKYVITTDQISHTVKFTYARFRIGFGEYGLKFTCQSQQPQCFPRYYIRSYRAEPAFLQCCNPSIFIGRGSKK